MTKQWLAHFNDSNLTLIGFLIFFCVFVAVIIWTFRKDSKDYYDSAAKLPLNDGDKL
ncbi:MAG: cbb3-type cytochrome c oxidase subunit 3 [Bdellovibrionales bacterium]|nr:cbb3-type cytochrome c oxidase subunit 3 [Bdellovibrionales bacterium]